MLIVPRKRICTQQPQGAAQIDRSNPITKGLVAVFIPSGGRLINAVGAVNVTNVGTVNYSPSLNGIGLTLTGSGNVSLSRASTYVQTNCAKHSILAVHVPQVSGAWQNILSIGEVTDTNYASGLSIGTANTLIWNQGGVGESGAGKPASSVGVNIGESNTSIFVSEGVSKRRFYNNGNFETNTSAQTNRASAGGLSIGCAYLNAAPVTSSRFAGDISLVLIFDRDLSHDEALSVSDNPWQIFRAPDSRIFVPAGAGAGGGENLTASSIIASPATVGSPLLSQKHALSASSIASAPAVVASPAITQRHALSATAVSASPAIVGSPSIMQRHSLTATVFYAGPAVVGSPTLTEVVAGVLTALPVAASPAAVGAPAITQKHALSSGSIAAGPAAFGTPSIEQQHVLMAHVIEAGSSAVGRPMLLEGGAVIFARSPSGSGYFRESTNTRRPTQTSTTRTAQ